MTSDQSISNGLLRGLARYLAMRRKILILAIIVIVFTGLSLAADYLYGNAAMNREKITSSGESGWTLRGGWNIENGDLIGRDQGQATFNESCMEGPLFLEFKLKMLEGGLNAAINVNESDGYIIGFLNETNGSISTYLIKYIENNMIWRIDGQRITYNPNADYLIEIENNASRIEVYVRTMPKSTVVLNVVGTEASPDVPLTIKKGPVSVIDYNDSSPLPSGRIAFQTFNGSSVRMSNITIYCQFCWDDEVPDLGPFDLKRPSKASLVNTPWGEVPANQVLVVVNDTVKNSTSVAEGLAKMLGGTLVGSFPYLNLFQIETKSSTAKMLMDNLNSSKSNESIELAFPNEQVYNETSPLDDGIYKANGKSYEIVGVENAWKKMARITLNHVHVGITDDGLYTGYGEFNGKNVSINATEYDLLEAPLGKFLNEGSHGTGVMNLLAADPGNGGLVGIASEPLRQKLKVTMINIFPDGNAYISDCFKGLRAEIMSGCYIISCSWGDNNANPDTSEAFEEFFRRIEKNPAGRKYLFIFSAGNGGKNKNGIERIPNGYPSGERLTNAITVGNVLNDGSMAPNSNYARDNHEFEVTLAAPGEQSVWGYNRTDPPTCSYGGTSMAVPYVTAAAALIRSIDRSLTAEGIKDILIRNGNRSINGKPAPNELGGVIISIDKAVQEAINKRCSNCQEDNKIPDIPADFEGNSGSIKPETSSKAQGLPKVESFSFTPNPVCLGEDTNLTWTTSNATGATIKPNVGEVEASGYRILTPEQSMTYSIWAWNDLGNSEVKRVLLIVEGCMEEGTTSQPPGANIIYDFMEEAYDEGQWQAGPPNVIFRLGERSESDSRGAALWKYDCLLSDRSIPGRVLQASPPQNGYVAGIYRHMNYLVDSSDHLTGRIGFIDGSKGGNVTFRISIIQGNLERNLMLRPLAYKDGMVPFDIPLEEYAGWQPAFSFRVEANGPSTQNNAVWQDVEIRGSSQRTVLRGTTTSGSNFASDFTSNIFNTDNNDLGTPGSIEDWLNRP